MATVVSRFMRGAAFALWLGCGSSMAADALPWFDGARPAPQALQAVELLAAAASQGLEPPDYNASALRQGIMNAAQGATLEAAEIAPLEQALTTAMERYLSDLHQGRIDPQKIHYNFNLRQREVFDAAAYLQTALAARRLPEAAAEAAPRLPLYAHLREALARYRELVDHPAWRQPLPLLPGGARGKAGKLEPGQDYAGLAMLAERLVAFRDLASTAPEELPPRYEGALVAAVQTF